MQTTTRTSKPKKPKPRKPARTLPPAWLAPGKRQKSEAHLYKLPAPPPAVKPGRQPHVAAMRFWIACSGAAAPARPRAARGCRSRPARRAPGAGHALLRPADFRHAQLLRASSRQVPRPSREGM
ncbi:hypothetical protein ACVOMV_32400 [Mesorhizobium atlanticum]